MVDYWKDVPGINEPVKEGKLGGYSWETDKDDDKKAADKKKKKKGKNKTGRPVKENAALDSDYLQNSLEAIIGDFTYGPEKKIGRALQWIKDRIFQSFPDGDVSRADIADLLKEPQGRKALKKSGMSSDEMVSMVMDF